MFRILQTITLSSDEESLGERSYFDLNQMLPHAPLPSPPGSTRSLSSAEIDERIAIEEEDMRDACGYYVLDVSHSIEYWRKYKRKRSSFAFF